MNKYIAQLLLKLLADKESRNRILTAVLSIAAGLLFLMAAPVIVLSSMKEMGAPSISFDETKLPSEISDRLDETEAEIKAIEDALTVIGLREQTVKAQLIYISYFDELHLTNVNVYANMFTHTDDRALIDNINSYYDLDIDYDEFIGMYTLVMNRTISEYIFADAEEKNSVDLAAWAVNAYDTHWEFREDRCGEIDEGSHLRCADNIGLIMGYIRYDPQEKQFSSDNDSLYYTPAGSLDSMPDIKGIGVHGDSGFGVYTGGGDVVFSSAMGGIQRQNITDGRWNEWCIYDAVSYPQEVYDIIEDIRNGGNNDESETEE